MIKISKWNNSIKLVNFNFIYQDSDAQTTYENAHKHHA